MIDHARTLTSYLSLVLTVVLLVGCHGQSDDPAAPGLAFDTPFDFNDDFYRKHGIDPDKLIKRLTPSHDSAAADKSQDTSRNGTRILQAFGGYDAVGSTLYYPLPPAPFKVEAFLDNAAGKRALVIADKFRAFILPRRDGDPLGTAAPNRREDNIFDTSSGYLTANPLGLWRLTFPRYTEKALNTGEGQHKLGELRERNGTDLDGTPIIKRLSEILELETLGMLELRQRPVDGSKGPPWVV
jgi:hypothetical protein